ncbi:hypothetical protein GN330_16860 [Nitratireductor sp. CAU 1489]|uniref:Uncharacterized protein n=1 Tax=Nitratireductor arenosus TaxID=2682096 RepID=A0A844QMT1_9HYPH|nr:hypothetical protein [Nitratireductor arenosus]MVA98919.1 hypothetical protein [Nitratireductor arenosus]
MTQNRTYRKTETLDFMQSMLAQLRTMAEAERLEMLAYLIEMAYVEASDVMRGERPRRNNGGGSDPYSSPRGSHRQ